MDFDISSSEESSDEFKDSASESDDGDSAFFLDRFFLAEGAGGSTFEKAVFLGADSSSLSSEESLDGSESSDEDFLVEAAVDGIARARVVFLAFSSPSLSADSSESEESVGSESTFLAVVGDVRGADFAGAALLDLNLPSRPEEVAFKGEALN